MAGPTGVRDIRQEGTTVELRKAWKSKGWNAEFGEGQVCYGATKSEAREFAYRTMEEMVSGDYRPVVLIHGNLTGVAWRAPAGWSSSISADDSDGRLEFGCIGSGPEKTRAEMERTLRRHMAQYATVTGSDLTDHSAFILNDEDRTDYLRWLGWQRAVRAAMDNGAS